MLNFLPSPDDAPVISTTFPSRLDHGSDTVMGLKSANIYVPSNLIMCLLYVSCMDIVSGGMILTMPLASNEIIRLLIDMTLIALEDQLNYAPAIS